MGRIKWKIIIVENMSEEIMQIYKEMEIERIVKRQRQSKKSSNIRLNGNPVRDDKMKGGG